MVGYLESGRHHPWDRLGVLAAATLAPLLAIGAEPSNAPPPAPKPRDIADRKQLFIDDDLVQSTRNIDWVVNPPSKQEIVLRSAPDEGGHELLLSTILPVGDEYYMYYMTFRTDLPETVKGDERHVTRVATSRDGLTWQRVRVGLIDIGQGLDNNIVMAGGAGTFFIDPNETDGCRYWWVGHLSERPEWPETKGTLFRDGPAKEGGIYLCRSKDGLRWTRVRDPILPFACDTRNQCLYDPWARRYVAYLRGRPAGHQSRVVSRAENDRLTGPWPFERDLSREAGPNGLFSELRKELPIVLAPHAWDAPKTGIYSPNVHVYPWAERVYLAFPETYRLRDGIDSHGRDERGKPGNEGPLEVSLAVSRDGRQWKRFQTPYVRLGRLGEIDAGTIYMGIGMIRRGDEIWQYTTVSPHTHHGFFKSLPGMEGGVRRVVQRLDGFVSADAGPLGGEIVTKPVIFAGNRLTLNADCGAAGEIWVALLNADAKPITGYTLDDAVSVDLNGVAQEVWWKRGPNVSALAGKPVRLHVRMRSAKLYAMQFTKS